MHMEFWASFYSKPMPYLAIIFLQIGYAGSNLIYKFALDGGGSQHVLVVYRNFVATIVVAPFAIIFDRRVRPRMTLSIFMKILLLGLLGPTMNQNLYYTGMKYTTATFAASMYNILPALIFMMAWCLRLEEVNLWRIHSQAKILGTIVTVGGAMVMTIVKGVALDLPWTKGYNHNHESASASTNNQDLLKGALMIVVGCLCWACFIILQAITMKSYPAELSLTALICLTGTIEGSILAAVMERGNPSAWSIHLDSKLLAAAYGGVICSGVAYYVQGFVMKSKGPVFVSAFSPLSMVIVAIMGSFLLSETMNLGRILGAIIIVIGLYMVLWGKSKDQPTSDWSKEKVTLTAPEMETMSWKIDTPNQESLAVDFTNVRPTNEIV